MDLKPEWRCKKCGCKERYSGRKCKACSKKRALDKYYSNPAENQARAAVWKRNNRARARVSGRKGGRTNWLPGEHEKAEAALLVTVMCEVCSSTNPRHKRGWNADHDHSTGCFRGIVCHPCNIAISHVEKFKIDTSAASSEA